MAAHHRSTGQVIGYGIIAGMVAGAVMAIYAMIASAWMGQGFFTPLYGIASPLIGPKEMETSMMQGIHVNPLPALLGAGIHTMWSAIYGVGFGLLWSRIGGTGAVAAIAGVLYGLVVMVVMMMVVLPLVGAGGMPSMIGFSFGLEHALFGAVLGLWPSVQPTVFPARAIWQARTA